MEETSEKQHRAKHIFFVDLIFRGWFWWFLGHDLFFLFFFSGNCASFVLLWMDFVGLHGGNQVCQQKTEKQHERSRRRFARISLRLAVTHSDSQLAEGQCWAPSIFSMFTLGPLLRGFLASVAWCRWYCRWLTKVVYYSYGYRTGFMVNGGEWGL